MAYEIRSAETLEVPLFDSLALNKLFWSIFPGDITTNRSLNVVKLEETLNTLRQQLNTSTDEQMQQAVRQFAARIRAYVTIAMPSADQFHQDEDLAQNWRKAAQLVTTADDVIGDAEVSEVDALVDKFKADISGLVDLEPGSPAVIVGVHLEKIDSLMPQILDQNDPDLVDKTSYLLQRVLEAITKLQTRVDDNSASKLAALTSRVEAAWTGLKEVSARFVSNAA